MCLTYVLLLQGYSCCVSIGACLPAAVLTCDASWLQSQTSATHEDSRYI